MRRIISLLAALVLLASVGASSAAAGPGPKANRFVGDFQIVEPWSGNVVGSAHAGLTPPTDERLVAGSYDFAGVPGNATRETHAQIANAHFWFDPDNAPGGANVALGEGVECVYWGPDNTTCHLWAVMFIDNLDPKIADQIAFANRQDANGNWVFDYWFQVGKGSFRVTLAQPS